MKNKVIKISLVIFAIVLYTLAVVQFIDGNVVSGISNVIMACSDVIMFYVMTRMDMHHECLVVITKEMMNFFERLQKGITFKVTEVDDEEDDEDNADDTRTNEQAAEVLDTLHFVERKDSDK